jgi:outer membrane lipoprotein carrier protein
MVIFIFYAINLWATSLLDSVIPRYTKIFSLEGNFTQTICDEAVGSCRQFSGKFYLNRPGFSRLEVISPEKQLIVADTQTLYIYLPKIKKVYLENPLVNYNLFKIFDYILENRTNFKLVEHDKDYTYYSFLSDSLSEFIPFQDIKIGINNRRKLIEKLSLTDLDGAEISFSFSVQKVNPKLSPKLFSFTPPQGVEIIDLR